MTVEIDVSPEQAVQDFLAERKDEVSRSSLRNYKYPLKELVVFCEERSIESVGDLNGYELKKFKLRRRQSGIKEVTLKNNLSTVRVFLRWCAEAELVKPGLAELVQLPTLDTDDRVSDDVLTLDHVEEILDYLYKYEYATRTHAAFQLMWHTCVRMGTLESIDLDDYFTGRKQIRIRHRPETGTPLKNGKAAERLINISDEMADVLDDYIEGRRHDVTDEYGREPLFTTRNNRLSHTVLRKNTYAITRPCHVGMGCPHDKEPENCRAANYKKAASKCPTSMSPHPLRRAAITYHLNQEWPKEKLSERANVSTEVLDEHYDARSEDERAATRKQYLGNL